MVDSSGAIINVRVTPRASRTAITGEREGVYGIKLTAPATGGKANRALLKLLSKRLGVPKGNIEIVTGQRARTKALRISGLAPEDVKKRMGSG